MDKLLPKKERGGKFTNSLWYEIGLGVTSTCGERRDRGLRGSVADPTPLPPPLYLKDRD